MEADIRKTPLEDEFRYHEIITEIYNHHPVGRQAIRLIDIINTKASALLTHVSIMLAVSTGLFAYISSNYLHHDKVTDIVTLVIFIEIVIYA
jgi:hypothetical protein